MTMQQQLSEAHWRLLAELRAFPGHHVRPKEVRLILTALVHAYTTVSFDSWRRWRRQLEGPGGRSIGGSPERRCDLELEIERSLIRVQGELLYDEGDAGHLDRVVEYSRLLCKAISERDAFCREFKVDVVIGSFSS